MNKKEKRMVRHLRVRKKVSGTSRVPRLSIFRSNKNLYAQLVNDQEAKTLAAVSTLNVSATKNVESQKSKKFTQAEKAGEGLAKAAATKKIKKVVFDRGGFKYHGRIKALAEAARKGGLIF